MKFIKTSLLFIVVLYLTGCASNYKTIQPRGINYISTNENDGISLQYRYDLLDKKYEKKEEKNGVKLVAIKITNNSDQDLIFGKDVTLEYENGKWEKNAQLKNFHPTAMVKVKTDNFGENPRGER